MKNIKKHLFWPVVLTIVLLAGLAIYGIRNKSDNIQPEKDISLIAELPSDWGLEIRDNSGCYIVHVYLQGSYNGSLEQYIHNVVNGGRTSGEIVDRNTYNINSPNVIDMGQQGVGNFNTLYIKSGGNVYALEINSAISEFEKESDKTCPNPEIIIKRVVEELL